MNHRDYEARLHACLDAGRDPLDDAELCEHLAEHAEDLAVFAALRADLHTLATLVAPTRRRRAGVRLAVTTAIATIAAGLFLLLLQLRNPAAAPVCTTTASMAAVPAATLPAPGRILAANLEEQQPRAHVAASFTVHQRLLASTSATLEIYETRSEVR
ncbi:MAG: hypothetical protein ABIP94_19735 [Planctomycetota bacterium]